MILRPVLTLLVLALAGLPVWAQSADPGVPSTEPAPASATLLIRITPRIVEEDQSVSWEQPLSKPTRPGVPVVVNINAESLAIRISVTPFVRGKDFLLVVQGDVKQTGESGTRRSSSLQSLLVPAGEPIAYFPLGREAGGHGREMVVLMRVEFQGE